ncbi:MSRA reductase, partial [Atractosteus spatula]|nr:MSRA reductase [Atractosteus spatula]
MPALTRLLINWRHFAYSRMGDMSSKIQLPTAEAALPGRSEKLQVSGKHHVNGNKTTVPPFPEGLQMAMFGMGCFWGAEKKFWRQNGVYSTQVGYAGGFTPNPTYEEVCKGKTGHAEVVRVVYQPGKISYEKLLKVFWESHDPTQGMRQGNDIGTQYRSAIYTSSQEQTDAAIRSKEEYQKVIFTCVFICPRLRQSKHSMLLFMVPLVRLHSIVNCMLCISSYAINPFGKHIHFIKIMVDLIWLSFSMDQQVLTENGYGQITTEIREGPEFYYAEDYHQQYLSKNPGGYCGLGGTGVSCPVGLKH